MNPECNHCRNEASCVVEWPTIHGMKRAQLCQKCSVDWWHLHRSRVPLHEVKISGFPEDNQPPVLQPGVDDVQVPQ